MEKIKNWFNKPKMSIFFYTLALIVLVYTCYTLYNSYDYVSGVVAQGSITWSANFEEIVSYFLSASAAYLFYGLTFVCFGYICQYVNPKTKVLVAQTETLEAAEFVTDEGEEVEDLDASQELSLYEDEEVEKKEA